MFSHISRIALVVLTPALFAGCWLRKKPDQRPKVDESTKVESTIGKKEGDPGRVVTSGDDTSTSPSMLTAEDRAILTEMIFFEFEEWALTPASRELLEKKLAILNRFPNLTISIDGHCDERGSDEVNIILGRRRAVAVSNFFTDRGVDGARVSTASFGRERPLVEGSNEEAYARNRRAEFRILSGGTP